ncbi:MAG TPA: tryptophan synthase subunit alpha [Candidatus Baltobacteraceae bacterium]|jgi:tryptophan synthase alpha chain|nr:tryptophan synthase subunit alpha [Candidatus Baltobacteraceae bacterium]
MTRYQQLREQITTTNAPVYLPYVMLGYPTAEKSLDVCRHLIKERVHGFELGLPFRDPVADGPVIEAAGNMALDNGMTTSKAVELVRKIRDLAPSTPLTLMSYYNMVLAKGADRFIGEFASAGIDGLLIPDITVERAEEVAPSARKHGVDLVYIVSPLSDERRIRLIKEYAGGFIYVVTRLGITGIESHYASTLEELFGRIHKQISLPAIAGFGISEPEQAVGMVDLGADGVITGSRLVQLIGQAQENAWDLTPVVEHTRKMLNTLSGLRCPHRFAAR